MWSWPYPVDSRGLGSSTAQPWAASSGADQRQCQPDQELTGPPWMSTASGQRGRRRRLREGPATSGSAAPSAPLAGDLLEPRRVARRAGPGWPAGAAPGRSRRTSSATGAGGSSTWERMAYSVVPSGDSARLRYAPAAVRRVTVAVEVDAEHRRVAALVGGDQQARAVAGPRPPRAPAPPIAGPRSRTAPVAASTSRRWNRGGRSGAPISVAATAMVAPSGRPGHRAVVDVGVDERAHHVAAIACRPRRGPP